MMVEAESFALGYLEKEAVAGLVMQIRAQSSNCTPKSAQLIF